MADRSIRASDGDRERVVEILREHTAQGRLTLDEFEERMTAAYAAKTWDDLRPLTRDLPAEVTFAHGRSGTQARPDMAAGPPQRPARGPAIPRAAYLLPLLILATVLAGSAVATGAFRAIPVPLLFIGLFWAFCGRGGCRPRARGSHDH